MWAGIIAIGVYPLYLWLKDKTGLSAGWSATIVTIALLAKGVDAPMAVIFIGAIGGLILSGIIGLFVGAVVMVLGYTLFMAWLKMEAETPAES